MLTSSQISVGLLSLGCPKTLVDSELILGGIDPRKYRLSHDLRQCDIAIVNTCTFIEEAKQESIDHILKLAELKREGIIKAVVVIGCLVQRYQEALEKELGEVDAFVGTGDYQEMNRVLDTVALNKKISIVGNHPGYLYSAKMPRVALTSSHYRYLKISEGCDHICTFCTIPMYRGKHRSRQIDDIVSEARQLVRQGAKELIVTGQDTSFFGFDTHQKLMLPRLLDALNQVEGLEWLRLLYAYPTFVNDELIDAINRNHKVCHYIDMPLQHISDKMLRAMKRGTNGTTTRRIIKKLRDRIRGVSIRTTFIVGFPGEGESEFQELLEYMEEVKFDRLGLFTYSQEEGSAAYHLPDQVPEEIKNERYGRGMEMQQKISVQHNKMQMNRKLKVLIDGPSENKEYQFVGRSYMDAPDVDGLVYLRSERDDLSAGDFVFAQVTGSQAYDLEADVIDEIQKVI